VNFGTPQSLRAWLKTAPQDVLSLPKEARLPELERLAREMLTRIGAIVPVTPVPLAAAALLSFGQTVVQKDALLERMDQLRDRLEDVNGKVVRGGARDCVGAEALHDESEIRERRGVGERFANQAECADVELRFRDRVFQKARARQQLDEVARDVFDVIFSRCPRLDFLRSYSKPGESVVFVFVKDSSRPDEIRDTWYQVRKKVGDIRLTLPQGVIGPFFNDEFGDTFGNIYAITGEGYTYAQLKETAENPLLWPDQELLSQVSLGRNLTTDEESKAWHATFDPIWEQ